LNIVIIAVGKLKEKYLKEGIGEYSKRLSRSCHLAILEVADEKAPENISLKDMENIKNKEGEGILRHFKPGMYKIALCIEGKMVSSQEFAGIINKTGLSGISNIAFIIGGSLGLSDAVVKQCDAALSFSRMTFPHQLMRLVLLEQIYRGFKIISGETYHK